MSELLLTDAQVQTKSTEIKALEFNQKMLEVLKYTMWSVAAIVYTFFVGAIFIYGHWSFGVASIFFISSAYPLRELLHKTNDSKSDLLASDAYDPNNAVIQQSLSMQRWLSIGLMLGTYGCSLIFVALTYIGINSVGFGVGALCGMVGCELLDFYSRRTSRNLSDVRQNSNKLREEIYAHRNEKERLEKEAKENQERSSE